MPEVARFRRGLCAALALAALAAAGLAATARAEYGEITHFGAFGKGETQFDTEEEEAGFGVNTKNNDVYVADLPDAKDEFRIQRFDPNENGEYGKPVATVKFKPTDDQGKEEDDEITNIAVDPNNSRIYVLVSEQRPEAAAIDHSDFAAVELWAFNTEGTQLTSLGAIAKEGVFKPLSEVTGEALLFPNGIAVDPTTGDVIIGFEQETAAGKALDALERINPAGALAEKRWSDPTSTEFPEGFLEDEATSPVVNKKGEVFVTREDAPNQGEIDKVPSSFASEGDAVSIFRLDPELEEEVLVRNQLLSFPGTSDQETPGVLSLGEEGTLYSSASITEQKNGKLTGPKFPGVLEFAPKTSEDEWTEEGWTGGQSIQSVGANGACKITASVLAQIAAGKEHDVFGFEMSTEHPSVIEFGPGGSGCRKGTVLPPSASTLSSGGEPIPETEPIPIKDTVTLSSTLAASNALSVEWEFGDGTKQLVSEDQLEKTSVEHVFKQAGKLEITEKIHTDDLAEPELVTHSKIDILGPVDATQPPSGVTETTAKLNGTVNPEGANVTKCTFEYGTSLPSGKTASCETLPGSGKGPVGVSASISGLNAGTKYTFKLSATNSNGTSESSTTTFETTPGGVAKPKVAVEAPEGVTETGAKLKGAVNPEGSEVKSCSFEYGTSLPSGKTAACTPATIAAGTSPVGVSATITGLSAGTKYTFKLTATNTGGTSESTTTTFETAKAAAAKPAVAVEAPESVTETGAKLKGTVNPEGSEVKSCSFEYGTSLPSGKTVGCTPATIAAGTSPVGVSATVTGLNAGTKYTFKLTATNTGGTSESTTTTFETTKAALPKPKVVLEAPSNVTEVGATLNGTVNPEGSEVKACSFEYGPSLPSGKTAACSPASIGSGTSAVSVSAAITGLSANTTYSVKLTATNANGTTEAAETFTTQGPKPAVASEAPGNVTEAGATLKGTVNPEGSEVKSCSFEYGTSLPSGKTVACSPATIPAGTSPVAVSAAVTGLNAGTKYTLKLTAGNTDGTSESATTTFETTAAVASKPKVVVEAPANVAETTATLMGTVNPEGSEVQSCMFEYGTSLPSGKTAACSPAAIGSAKSAVSVSAAVGGLAPITGYSVKLTATNGIGTAVSTTTAFTTGGTPVVPPPLPGGVPTIISPPPGGGGVLGNKAVGPAVTISGSPSAVAKTGSFTVKLKCATGATSCSGTVTLKTSKAIVAKKGKKPAILTLATGAFALSGGQLKPLTLHLSSTARTVLARTHVLSALATIVARDAAAETATTKASFSLHPVKAAPKH